MKSLSLICLSACILASVAPAQQAASYPEEQPIIDLRFPDDWTLKTKEGVLYAHPSADKGFFMSLRPLKTPGATGKAAIKEAKNDIEDLFQDVEYQKPETKQVGDLNFTLINAKGRDQDGQAVINIWLIDRDGGEAPLLLKCVSSPQAFEDHAEVGRDIINSISPHVRKSEKVTSRAKSDVQTYNYPDEANPTFTMDLPADWTVSNLEGGFRVYSADKKFVATITPLKMDTIMDGMNTIGQMLTKNFETCVWNNGGKCKASLDEKTGYSLTENTGVAENKDGKKFLLRLNQYARQGSDTFFVLSTLVHADAEEANADGIDMMLSSIKHQ